MTKKIFIKIFFLLFLIYFFSSSIKASQKRIINFQGRLTDQKGNPLDGAYNIKFNIYPSDPNTPLLWTEEHTDVSVKNGIVNVLLGSITSFDEPVKVNFDEERYLGITIDCDHDPNTKEDEMTPRQRILPAIYSYDADKLDGKDSSEYTTPQTDAGRPGVVENLYEGNIRLVDKYIRQADLGSKGCYVSYRNTCGEGFTKMFELGSYGVCQPMDINSGYRIYIGNGILFSPPGATCGSIEVGTIGNYRSHPCKKQNWGTACMCCK